MGSKFTPLEKFSREREREREFLLKSFLPVGRKLATHPVINIFGARFSGMREIAIYGLHSRHQTRPQLKTVLGRLKN